MCADFSVHELIDRYADTLWKKGAHRNSSLIFLNEIADLKKGRFAKIISADYTEIANLLKDRGNKNSTVNRKIFAFTKLLRKAQEDDLIPNVPVFERLNEDTRHVRYLSKDEERVLVNALRAHDTVFSDLSIFLIDTGMTLGEAIELRWESLTETHASVVESSIGLGRRLPLTNRCIAILSKYRFEARGPFCDVEQAKFRITWNRAKRDTDFCNDPAVVPTILRHTCACRLVLSGFNLRLVQNWLGNKDYKSMMRYEGLLKFVDFEACSQALESFGATK